MRVTTFIYFMGWVLIIVCRIPVEMDVNSFFCFSQCRFCNAQSIAKGLTYHSWSCNRRKRFSYILKVLSPFLIDAATTQLSHQFSLWIYTTRKKKVINSIIIFWFLFSFSPQQSWLKMVYLLWVFLSPQAKCPLEASEVLKLTPHYWRF